MLRTKEIQAALVIFLLISVWGCEHKGARSDDRVLARVNSYELKVSDFKEAADPLLLKQYESYSSAKDKEQILETLISKEVLLQEAQRLNLDKEKSFMKEIEGYWEQALLKSLINRKIKELSMNIVVSDNEIRNEYDRLKRRISAELFIFSDKASAQELSKSGSNFEAVRGALKDKIISEVPADWYVSGDLPPKIENILFVMKPQELSPVIEYNNSWVILRVLNQEERKIEPIEESKDKIRQDIVRVKQQDLLEGWSDGLRRKASVKINREVLKELD